MRVRFRYLVEDRDRHGNIRIYFRYPGFRKVRLSEVIGSREFAARYESLRAQFTSGQFVEEVKVSVRPTNGTLGWLTTAYRSSADFKMLDLSTQRTRTRVIESMLDEPVHPGAKERYREFPVDRIGLKALEVLRDRKKALPGSASDRVKALRALFKWAAAEKHCAVNPALPLRKIVMRTDGHHTWAPEEIDQYEQRHKPGTKAHLALQLLLYTGARRSDAVRLGRQHLQGSSLRWTAYKNRNRFPVTLHIPLLPPLEAAIAASPTGDLVFLVTEFGKPFSIAGFGNWFRDRCSEAGLSQRSAHGLRKAGSTRAAEAGATAHQLMAMFGWRSLAEAELYTKAAERKKMAAAGMQFLLIGVERAASVPLSDATANGGTNRRK